MSFFESDYTPTDADLQDWIHVLKLNEAEDFGNDDADKGYPYDSEYDDDIDSDMDGDATSALESVYGPTDYPEYYYDDGWCDFEDNGEGFAC